MLQTAVKSFKHLDIITAFFVAVLIISNIASSKIAQIGPLSLDGGTFLFPLTYIFGDILTEVYGFKKARRVIWLGVFANLIMALTFMDSRDSSFCPRLAQPRGLYGYFRMDTKNCFSEHHSLLSG